MLILGAFSLLIVLIIILKLKWFTHVNCKSKVCLAGKTALVTGGNSGIGYQIVLGLLQRGCRVIIADVVKDQNLFENIYKETNSRNVVFQYVDLSSLKSTRELAKNIIKSEKKLDILIHNAGVGGDVSTITEDGLNLILQINYFSAFLLTHLLVGLLKEANGRIIFTGSGLSYFNDFSVDKLRAKEDISAYYHFHYHNSKLCLIIAGDMFAEKLTEYGVTSNTYHPGLVRTDIFKKSINHDAKFSYNKLLIMVLAYLAWLCGTTAEEAAQTAIYLACATGVKNITGKYFYECKPTFKPRSTQNKKNNEEIWKTTEELVNLSPEERL